MRTPEEMIADRNAGKMGEIVLQSLTVELDQMREATLNKIRTLYRSGEATHSDLLSCAAELVSLDDLENRLKAKVRRGQSAAKEMLNGNSK